MSEIPEDVRMAATALAARWFYEKWDPDDYICKLLVRYVAEDMMTQILAERERCAKLALSAPTLENKTKMFGSQINELYATQENLKRLIALYIRGGATT